MHACRVKDGEKRDWTLEGLGHVIMDSLLSLQELPNSASDWLVFITF